MDAPLAVTAPSSIKNLMKSLSRQFDGTSRSLDDRDYTLSDSCELLQLVCNVSPCMGFSSPELKDQVSFSDQNLFIVCRRCRKLFTFSSSSQEPLGQFQPNLAQSILGWRGFKFVQMKGHTLSQGEIIAKILKLY